MNEELERRLGERLARWVDAARRHHLLVITLFCAAAAASIWYALGHLGIEGDTESMFAADLPFKRHQRRYFEAFPAQQNTLFVVVDAATPERANDAAQRLATGLRDRPREFHSVFLPGGGEFFERHAYLYLEIGDLHELSDRLAQAQPYLAALSRDGSLRGFAAILARAARAAREGVVPGDQLATLFDRTAAALDARVENHPYYLSWSEIIAAHGLDPDRRRRFLLVEPELQPGAFQPAERSLLALRRIVRGLHLPEDVRVRVTGEAALAYEELEVVRSQAISAGISSFVLVALLLLLALRSLRPVLAIVVTLLIGLALTAGFTAIAIGHLNLISVSFAVLFIGLGVDFGIHLCMRYRELMAHGRFHPEALRETARDVGTSIALCALTTAIGFFAFVPTAFVGVAELGLISGAGMLISLFCALTLLPAMLSLPPLPRPHGSRAGTAWAERLVELPVRFPRSVRAAAIALAAACVVLLPQARFDHNPLNVRDPDSESVRTLHELLEHTAGSPWSLNALAPDLAAAERLAARLAELDEVESVVTISDFIPREQEEKLGIIEEMALFLETPPSAEEASGSASAAEQMAALRQLSLELDQLLATDGVAPALGSGAGALRASLERYLARLARYLDPAPSLAALEESLLGSLPEQLRAMDAALTASRVTLQDLPEDLVEQMLAADGSVRVQILPREDLQDEAALARFVDAVREVEPEVAGSAAEIVSSGRTVVSALRQAMLSALVAVTLLMLLLWRRLTDTALVLIPLALASALTVASAVLLDIPFNFADVIVLPLLLGIGVDSGIHLVHRARASREGASSLLGSSTARAVAFSALTTIASFGSLAFATHRGLATLGQLLTLGVGFTLLSNLVVLPALIVLHPPAARGSPAGSAARS